MQDFHDTLHPLSQIQANKPPDQGKLTQVGGRRRHSKRAPMSLEERRLQNRLAQRQFRDRRDRYTRQLEEMVEYLRNENQTSAQSMRQEIDRLTGLLDILSTENDNLRQVVVQLSDGDPYRTRLVKSSGILERRAVMGLLSPPASSPSGSSRREMSSEQEDIGIASPPVKVADETLFSMEESSANSGAKALPSCCSGANFADKNGETLDIETTSTLTVSVISEGPEEFLSRVLEASKLRGAHVLEQVKSILDKLQREAKSKEALKRRHPASMPTLLQCTIPHDPRVDLIPCPLLRDKMIIHQNQYDITELINLMVEKAELLGDDPGDPDAWRLPLEFFQNYEYLVAPACKAMQRDVQIYVSQGLLGPEWLSNGRVAIANPYPKYS
ncbi:uncharacterized protein VTP21DRAFT_8329 [Calcarisporiella thermophila]|uniref:uncharacterized protein n=1 Tax=Calcarisporiella thermophila TaxID=911321 RepID=UPI003742A6F1